MKNGNFKTQVFSPLIERVLAGVHGLGSVAKVLEAEIKILNGFYLRIQVGPPCAFVRNVLRTTFGKIKQIIKIIPFLSH